MECQNKHAQLLLSLPVALEMFIVLQTQSQSKACVEIYTPT